MSSDVSLISGTAERQRSWRSFLFGMSVFLAAALLLALTVIAFFGDLNWRVRMLTPFRPQYAGLGVVLITVAWLRRCHWTTRVLSVGVVGVNLAVLWPWLLPIRDAQPQRSFTLMSWNTWTFHPDPSEVARVVSQSGADVALLCETPSSWRDVPPPKIDGYLTFTHNQYVIAVREDGPVQVESTRHAKPPNNMEAHALFQDRPLRLLSVHASRPTTSEGCWVQDWKLQNLERWHAEEDLPCIIGGDFNATSWCNHLAATLKRLKLRDASKGHGVGPTFPTWPPVLDLLGGVPIDHCFYSPDFSVGRRWIGRANGSNHRPVFVEIGWRHPASRQQDPPGG